MIPFAIFFSALVVAVAMILAIQELTKEFRELRIKHINEMANIRKETVELRRLAVELAERYSVPRPHVVKNP